MSRLERLARERATQKSNVPQSVTLLDKLRTREKSTLGSRLAALRKPKHASLPTVAPEERETQCVVQQRDVQYEVQHEVQRGTESDAKTATPRPLEFRIQLQEPKHKIPRRPQHPKRLYTAYFPTQQAQARAYSNFLLPSPDDLVLQQHAKAFAEQQLETELLEQQECLEKLQITPGKTTPLRFPLSAKNALVAVVGQMHAGKSTLIGRLKATLREIPNDRLVALKMRNARAISKGEALENLHYAWLMESSREPRALELRFGDSNCVVCDTVLEDLDWIVSLSNLVVIVVDCSPGAFEQGFSLNGVTRDAILACRAFVRSRTIIFALNKIDAIDGNLLRLQEITHEIAAFIEDVGLSMRYVAFWPCAGLTGDGIEKKPSLQGNWVPDIALVEEFERFASQNELLIEDGDVASELLVCKGITVFVSKGYVQQGDKFWNNRGACEGIVEQIQSLDSDMMPKSVATEGQLIVISCAMKLSPGDTLTIVRTPMDPKPPLKSQLVRKEFNIRTFFISEPLAPGTTLRISNGLEVCESILISQDSLTSDQEIKVLFNVPTEFKCILIKYRGYIIATGNAIVVD